MPRLQPTSVQNLKPANSASDLVDYNYDAFKRVYPKFNILEKKKLLRILEEQGVNKKQMSKWFDYQINKILSKDRSELSMLVDGTLAFVHLEKPRKDAKTEQVYLSESTIELLDKTIDAISIDLAHDKAAIKRYLIKLPVDLEFAMQA